MLNVRKKLLFLVDDDRNVFLCFGPVQIQVCDHPVEFAEWQEQLVEQLNAIKYELEENYIKGDD